MPVFYTLHELFNTLKINENEDGKIEHGKRNSKLFLLGTFIWVVIFVLVMNIKLQYHGTKTSLWIGTLFHGLVVLAIADCIVMAYTYKSYFGRNLSWEMKPEESDKKFDYDYEKEKYIRNPTKEIVENTKVKIAENIANNVVHQVTNDVQNIQRPTS